MLVTEYTDCNTCAVDSDTGYPYKTCAKCNTQLCAWCPNVCLTDNDDNKIGNRKRFVSTSINT